MHQQIGLFFSYLKKFRRNGGTWHSKLISRIPFIKHSTMTGIIETENLTKHFGSVHAVNQISLHVRKGEIYGFLGLNGAGKTTTIRMLLGMIRPTGGKAILLGRKIGSGNSGLWNRVGFMVEIPYSYPDLTVRENLNLFRRLRLIRNPATVDEVMEKLKLTPYHDRKVKNLSLGNAQRLGLAKAIFHKPEILILDEPANGLDPAGIVEIRELLHKMAFDDGVTIFISSHILGEISRFATRIGIIHEGRMVVESDMAELDRSRKRCLRMDAPDRKSLEKFLLSKGFQTTHSENGLIEITDAEFIKHPEKMAATLVKEGLPPSLLKVEVEDLESFFLRTVHMKGGQQ
jgi:ABC-2 type transport system ATP-binding protein